MSYQGGASATWMPIGQKAKGTRKPTRRKKSRTRSRIKRAGTVTLAIKRPRTKGKKKPSRRKKASKKKGAPASLDDVDLDYYDDYEEEPAATGKSTGAKLGERAIIGAAKEAAKTVVVRTIPRPRLTRRQLGTVTRNALGFVKGNVKGAVGVGISALGAGVASGGSAYLAAVLGLAAAAGIAAYKATTWLINRGANEKERLEIARVNAALAFQQARGEAMAALERELTAAEVKTLSLIYQQRLREIL